MRIRVLAEPQSGVPQVKSWFNVEQENTVASLKTSLCASISALREARVQAIELVLVLDDFELLDNAAVHILRDGDLVWYVEQQPTFFLSLINLVEACVVARTLRNGRWRRRTMLRVRDTDSHSLPTALRTVTPLRMALVETTPLTTQGKGLAFRLLRLPPAPVRIRHPVTPLPTRNLPQTRALIQAVPRPPLMTSPLFFHLQPITDS